ICLGVRSLTLSLFLSCSISLSLSLSLSLYVRLCVCVFVCEHKRERKKQRERKCDTAAMLIQHSKASHDHNFRISSKMDRSGEEVLKPRTACMTQPRPIPRHGCTHSQTHV